MFHMEHQLDGGNRGDGDELFHVEQFDVTPK